MLQMLLASAHRAILGMKATAWESVSQSEAENKSETESEPL